MLDILIRDIRDRGVTANFLEATDMGQPLYKKYGFVKMDNEVEFFIK